MVGWCVLTEIFIAALEPVCLHLAIEVLLALNFLFKLLVVSILELRAIEFLSTLDVLSESEPIKNFATSTLLLFTRLRVFRSTILLESAFGLEWPMFKFKTEGVLTSLVLSRFWHRRHLMACQLCCHCDFLRRRLGCFC